MSQVIDWTKISLLVVEDDLFLREVLVELFETKNCKLHVAENGQQALDIVSKNKIHVVVSDVRMPVMDGVQLLKKIRELDPEIPVVFLATGFSDISDDHAIQLGASAVFHKPFDIVSFLDQIETMLAKEIHKIKPNHQAS